MGGGLEIVRNGDGFWGCSVRSGEGKDRKGNKKKESLSN